MIFFIALLSLITASSAYSSENSPKKEVYDPINMQIQPMNEEPNITWTSQREYNFLAHQRELKRQEELFQDELELDNLLTSFQALTFRKELPNMRTAAAILHLKKINKKLKHMMKNEIKES